MAICQPIPGACKQTVNAKCVIYRGPNLPPINTYTYDNLQEILIHISEIVNNLNPDNYDAENIGDGTGVFAQKSGNTLQFKSLVPGTGIQITHISDEITITATGGGGGNSWDLLGNAGTTTDTNFVGTIDDEPLMFKINSERAGFIGTYLNGDGFMIGSVAFGQHALLNASPYTSTGNVAIGALAMRDYVGAGANVAIGRGAMLFNKTSYRSVVIGEFAMQYSWGGDHNTYVGDFAGEVNSGAGYNTGVGGNAMRGNKQGGFNVATGFFSLLQNTTAIDYVTITNGGSGYTTATVTFSAPEAATPGTTSTQATGTVVLTGDVVTGITITNRGSGYSNEKSTVTATITGDGTGATGTVVLISGANNVASGYAAHAFNRIGKGNVVLGYEAGMGLLNAAPSYIDDNLVLLGYGASRSVGLSSETKLTNATAIGYNSKVGASNTMSLGGLGADAVNVGINTDEARAKLDVVDGDILVHELTVGRGGGSLSTNTVFGLGAFETNTSVNNGLVGNNVIIGNSAFANANGANAETNNVIIGFEAVKNVTNAHYNMVTIGYRAGLNADSASEGLAIGYGAMSTTTSGNRFNHAVGMYSLANVTGQQNTAIGYYAGHGTTSGTYNVSLGSLSMGAGWFGVGTVQGEGHRNVAVGHATLYYNNTGDNNIAIGYNAMFGPLTSSNTIAIGYGAGTDLTTGDYNVIIGGNSGASIAALDNYILIADGQGNERIRFNNSGAMSSDAGADYGSAGEVWTSNGSAAAPSWQIAASDTNFANTDLTANGNRTHDWDGNDLEINNINRLSEVFNNFSFTQNDTALSTAFIFDGNEGDGFVKLLYDGNDRGFITISPAGVSISNSIVPHTGSAVGSISILGGEATLDGGITYIKRLTNLTTQDRLIGQLSSSDRLGYLTLGSGLSISSGVLNTSGTVATPISSLTAATANNTINNTNYTQAWTWNSFATSNALALSATSTTSIHNSVLFSATVLGANATSSITTRAAYFSNVHSGTNATNIGLSASASGGTTNIGLEAFSGVGGISLSLGQAGSGNANIRFLGGTSGAVTIQTAVTAGTYTLTLPTDDGNSGEFLRTDGSGVLSWAAASSVTPAALTKVDDTNVTLTLGGTPATALLQATSLTLGWTGTLADARITSSANWNTAYTNRITSLTTTGSSGAATLIANTLNIPNYTLAGLGGIGSLAAIGSSPNANGATISGSTLNLEPASASFGGVVTTGTQTLAGNKTLSGITTLGNYMVLPSGTIAGGARIESSSATGYFGLSESNALCQMYWNNNSISVSTGQIMFNVAGVDRFTGKTTEAVFNDNAQNYNFRVEGQTDANLFVVVASTDKINIGNPSITLGKLNVNGAVWVSGGFYTNSGLLQGDFTDAGASWYTGSGTVGLSNAAGDMEFLGVATKSFIFNQGGLDVDFIIESDVDTDAFFLNGANSNVTLGGYGGGTITGTATYALQVDSTGKIIEGALSSGGLTFAQAYSLTTLGI